MQLALKKKKKKTGKESFDMLFLERFTDSLFQLIFGRVPSKAAACNSALGHESVCHLKQWALHGVSDCQLVRFPDRHFQMWGKIYFATPPPPAPTGMCACLHTHPTPLLSLSVLKIICLQLLETELTQQQNNWLSVTFKGRRASLSPRELSTTA